MLQSNIKEILQQKLQVSKPQLFRSTVCENMSLKFRTDSAGGLARGNGKKKKLSQTNKEIFSDK